MLILNKISTIENFFERKINFLFKPLLSPIFLAAITLLILNILSEIFIVHFISYSYKSLTDREAYISEKTLTGKKGPTVWHFGGSALIAGLDDDFILKSKVNGKLSFINLANPDQTVIESLALMRKANIKNGDLVVMHTSIKRINHVFPDARASCDPRNNILFHKDLVSAQKEFGLTQEDVPLACYLTFFSKYEVIKTIVNNILRGDKYINGADHEGIHPDEKIVKIEKAFRKNPVKETIPNRKKHNKYFRATYFKFVPKKADLFKKIVLKMNQHVNSIGAKLILLGPPENIDWYKKFFPDRKIKPALKNYHLILHDLETEGIPYKDFREDTNFSYFDFYDHTHFLPVGRDKFYPMYMDVILPFFKGLTFEEQH